MFPQEEDREDGEDDDDEEKTSNLKGAMPAPNYCLGQTSLKVLKDKHIPGQCKTHPTGYMYLVSFLPICCILVKVVGWQQYAAIYEQYMRGQI